MSLGLIGAVVGAAIAVVFTGGFALIPLAIGAGVGFVVGGGASKVLDKTKNNAPPETLPAQAAANNIPNAAAPAQPQAPDAPVRESAPVARQEQAAPGDDVMLDHLLPPRGPQQSGAAALGR